MINPKKFEIPLKSTYKLDRMRLASALLDHPELGRKTILVSGTNGKGSTVAYLTELFKASGLKVGTYSSPHVVSRTERIRINSKPISEFELKNFEKKFERILEPLTYFERMTILAFLIFRSKNVDVQVLEVGLGGRLDATNISEPNYSVISKIDFDHQEILGSRLAQIAREKAGIMRRGRTCFISSQAKEALESLRISAAAIGSRLELSSLKRFSSTIESAIKKVERARGKHQVENLRLALSVFEEASFEWGLKVSPQKILKAFEMQWPGRQQIVSKKPLYIVDGAHNKNAVEALVTWLKAKARKQKFKIVFGLMNDKDPKEVIRLLKPFAKSVLLPENFYPERQMRAEDLKKFWGKEAQTIKSLKEACKPSKEPTLVVGSFYLAGAVLKELKALKVVKF